MRPQRKELPLTENDSRPWIPVCSALVDGNEARYLKECIDTSWVSSSGPFVKRFEADFAAHVGTRHAATASSGTAALHLALLALGVGPGDEVIVPALTMIASANAVHYTGATAVVVDVDPETANLSVDTVAPAITPRTKAVMAVHLYGLPAPMTELQALCAQHHLALVEDAAEAIGTTWEGRPAGSWSDIAAFSFFANKVITTGEGGMVTTTSDALFARIQRFKDQWFVPERRFFHPEVGFNYRMSNLQAAVGVAQLERVEEFVAARLAVAKGYRERLGGVGGLELPADDYRGGRNSHWMYAIRLTEDSGKAAVTLAAHLREHGIDSRGFFVPLNQQPAFAQGAATCPVAASFSRRGLLLPTGPTLASVDQDRVADALVAFLRS
jgi:perosamine synthetase